MKTYKEKITQVLDDIYCDICGVSCSFTQYGYEFATLEALWGYCSKMDGTKYEIHLCENCFKQTISFLKRQRKINLIGFKYPFKKDPLDPNKENLYD